MPIDTFEDTREELGTANAGVMDYRRLSLDLKEDVISNQHEATADSDWYPGALVHSICVMTDSHTGTWAGKVGIYGYNRESKPPDSWTGILVKESESGPDVFGVAADEGLIPNWVKFKISSAGTSGNTVRVSVKFLRGG